jgi:hypothetical protein
MAKAAVAGFHRYLVKPVGMEASAGAVVPFCVAGLAGRVARGAVRDICNRSI